MTLRIVSIVVLAAALALLRPSAAAQNQPLNLGGSYDQLLPRQQALVQRWVSEYNGIVHRKVTAAEIYDNLPLSARTTFQAITHALANSKLTSKDGKPLGYAIDLVDVIERVAGQVPATRGDRQFRVYVYLKPGAVNKLYSAREFVRTHDNTVYHIGYPINFRQQGGVPSVQFSVARTGRRADIDVDYRSSSGVKALVSGHLTSANSDIRAGNNEAVHNRRWSGLSNWWRDLMAVFIEKPAPEESTHALSPGAELERRRIARGPIDEAIYSYLNDWLVKNKPEDLLPLFSIRAYPCVAEFGAASPDAKLALARILNRLHQRTRNLGPVSSIDNVVHPISYRLPGSRPAANRHEKIFSLQEVPLDVAWAIDCRVRYRMDLIESIPRPQHQFDNVFVASMRIDDPKEPQAFLVQTWAQDGGEWRIVSFDIKRKNLSPPIDILSETHSAPPPHSDAGAVLAAAARLFDAWFVAKQPAEAAAFFLPGAVHCSAEPGAALASSSADFVSEVLSSALPDSRIEGVIAAPLAGHHELKPIQHPHSGAFLLAELRGDLLRSTACGTAPPQGQAKSVGYATLFHLVQAPGADPAAITLFWTKSPDGWRVASYSVVSD
ncbi:MAG: hypothetical protein HY821_22380 [Acidobacteria bacterium]|nr:hypothetical protein [Acidobacteriota bacterium]